MTTSILVTGSFGWRNQIILGGALAEAIATLGPLNERPSFTLDSSTRIGQWAKEPLLAAGGDVRDVADDKLNKFAFEGRIDPRKPEPPTRKRLRRRREVFDLFCAEGGTGVLALRFADDESMVDDITIPAHSANMALMVVTLARPSAGFVVPPPDGKHYI